MFFVVRLERSGPAGQRFRRGADGRNGREEALAAAEGFPQIEAAQASLSTIGEVTEMSHATLVDAR